MLIDFHTHCFPEKISERAIGSLSFASGGLFNNTDGTVTGLKEKMAADGVDASVVLNIATNAHQMPKVNDFAAAINDEKSIFSFGSVFPDAPDALDELDRIKALGLKGVKLHPDYQGFSVDDPKMIPIYKKISSLGLITVFHAGVDIGFPPPYGCTPDKSRGILKYFDTPVVLAHLGGIGCYEQVIDLLCGQNVYLDTAFCYAMLPKCKALEIFEKHGCDRILFGTDIPWQTAPMTMRFLNTLGLSDSDMDKVTHKNAMKLLGI